MATLTGVMRFTKMHGCGNDYVVVEALDTLPTGVADRPSANAALVRAMCDRRFGVGADGWVLVRRETRGGSSATFEMQMHNPDGSHSAMCGNALRCVAKRLIDAGVATGESVVVRSGDTIVPMRVTGRGDDGRVEAVEADLGPPELSPSREWCDLDADAEGRVRDADLAVDGRTVRLTAVSMGNPHAVLFTDQFGGGVHDAPVTTLGPQIENHPAFPDRMNVEFVEVVAPDRVRQRTWERGAGETLACGSGACAVGVAGVLTGRTERRLTVELLGGELRIEWRESDGHVLMAGPAVEVFVGEWPDA
ncbi:MAG: diaminopimelate epimerase, partial [Planctomycetota bacterium]